MGKGFFNVPTATNEPVRAYAPGSQERADLLATYKNMYNQQGRVVGDLKRIRRRFADVCCPVRC